MDDTKYHHVRHLRFECRVDRATVIEALGLSVDDFKRLEATDMEFWKRHVLQAYLRAIGFLQWCLTHEDGRRTRAVIALGPKQAARLAGWSLSQCASIEPALDAREWVMQR